MAVSEAPPGRCQAALSVSWWQSTDPFGWMAAGGSAHALGAQCLVVPAWHTVRPQQVAASPFMLRQKVLDGPKGGLMRLGVQGTPGPWETVGV